MNYPIRTTDADLKSDVTFILNNGSNMFAIENTTGIDVYKIHIISNNKIIIFVINFKLAFIQNVKKIKNKF